MDKQKELKSQKDANRKKYETLNQDIEKINVMQEQYHNLALDMKREIDQIYLCWTGKEAIRYMNEASESLIHSKEAFQTTVEEQKRVLKQEKQKLDKEYEQIEATLSKLDKDKENEDENKRRGNQKSSSDHQ